MKQPSAISSRFWATTANASRKATSSVRKLWSFLAVLTLLMLSSAVLILGATATTVPTPDTMTSATD